MDAVTTTLTADRPAEAPDPDIEAEARQIAAEELTTMLCELERRADRNEARFGGVADLTRAAHRLGAAQHLAAHLIRQATAELLQS